MNMKKIAFILIAILSLPLLHGQTITSDHFSHLKLHYDLPPAEIDSLTIAGNTYSYADMEDFHLGGAIGSPALPLRTDLLTIPFCDSITVEISNARYDTLPSPTGLRWLPLQPSPSKRQRGPSPFTIDEAAYSADTFIGVPTASIEIIGIARDRRLAQLTFAPLQINPTSGDYILCRSADITINYHSPDSLATLDHYRRYHTPAFGIKSLNRLIPSKFTPIKSVRTTAPLRMVIVAHNSLRCRALTRFAEWKRKQGFIVDLVFTSTSNLNSPDAVASYLKGLYSSATTSNPAPTYLLIVGDHNQIPAFQSKLNDEDYNNHITDLYFSTWTDNDILPDCYYGRFSATDTNQLSNIIRKTIFYENYSFPDDSYLENAVLIAGVDHYSEGDNAYTYADPTMDYATHFYINSNNGYQHVYYYKNDTAFAPNGVIVTGSSQSYSTSAELRDLYNGGIGWVNYSAHGDWNKWQLPAFTVTHANAMTNINKPSFMIGNCCLSNKFDEPTCLGEALLRKGSNAGAAAYIGATNSTYWYEDLYWSVGVRKGIYGRINSNYNRQNQGVYDGLFHTHNEAFSEQCHTAGSMIFKGCMSVFSSSAKYIMRAYYWEIYHLMGDPSLMPWLGKADSIYFAADTSSRPIRVQAPPFAYVAMVDTASLTVIAAAFTDSNGEASLSVSADADLAAINYSVSAQGYRPYFSKFTATNDDFKLITTPFVCYPNPASTECTVKHDDMLSVRLFDSRGILYATYQPADGRCILDLSNLPRGLYFINVKTTSGYETQPLVVR